MLFFFIVLKDDENVFKPNSSVCAFLSVWSVQLRVYLHLLPLFVCLPVHQYACCLVCLFVYLSECPFLCFIWLAVIMNVSVYLFVCLSAQFLCLSLSVRLFGCVRATRWAAESPDAIVELFKLDGKFNDFVNLLAPGLLHQHELGAPTDLARPSEIV